MENITRLFKPEINQLRLSKTRPPPHPNHLLTGQYDKDFWSFKISKILAKYPYVYINY